ncbi:MAG: 4-(cytidine 5'-diphospho)-2-C-methyl-D-erythritol kinase, partial [Gammaproteobacteria bacterium]|nr:4-(cytidine 5'-diphospho)-2-C-methyl-D-erythritol kinase [Gammaproteobacteria bacterium]
EDDLAVRAARLLKAESGTRLGCDIALSKVIPVGGGMGGGSSDAAAVLVGLNELWGLGLDEARLAELGLSLGADVPLFVRGFSAFAEGVGEKLSPVSLGDTWYLVVTPHSRVATGEVFRHPALTRNSAPLKIDRFTRDMVDGATRVLDFAALWRATRNDCEAVVRGISPPVDAAFRWLGAYAEARLTGTGASVFAPFPSGAEAERVRERLPDEFRGIVARGVDRAVRRCAD